MKTLSDSPSPGDSAHHDLSSENISKAIDSFVKLLGKENVISDLDARQAHAITKWSPAAPHQIPHIVVFPSSTADVSAIMSTCSQRRIPVVGYSGGTSVPGAIAATRGGICVDFKHMNKILATHKEDMDVVLQPAVDWQQLNAHLDSFGLFSPPDPGPGAMIGGMIALNCSGTNAYRYGPMKQWVVSMTVVMADGTTIVTRRRPRKSSAGYDLTSMFVGSEGTLGLVTEAVLKVTSVPKNVHVAVASFPTTINATNAATALVHSGLPTEALELLDKHSMWAINQAGLSSKKWKESPTLFLKFAGLELAVQAQLEIFKEAAKENHYEELEISARTDDIEASWGARKNIGPSLMAMKTHPTDLFLSADAAVPISRLADVIEETHQVIKDAGLAGSTLGHVGDGEFTPQVTAKIKLTLIVFSLSSYTLNYILTSGNFHTVIVCPESQRNKGEDILNWVQKRAIQVEGTVTGEHGVGFKLRDHLVDEVGVDAVSVMKKIKEALDPGNILNPDKVFRLENGI
ncbi:D-lactate ferricytochrome c oxidoreductase [Lecanora helva]